MTNLLKYYMSKRKLPLIIASGILFVLAFVITISSDMKNGDYAATGIFYMPMVFMMLLVTIVPIYEFSFKMKKNGIDEYYSLPIKRSKLYMTKLIVGIVDIVIPFTISFVTMVSIILCRENSYNYNYLLPYYLVLVASGICVYIINSFAFTRANTIFDGLELMSLYSIILVLIVSVVEEYISFAYGRYSLMLFGFSSYFFSYSGIVTLSTEFAGLISNLYGFSGDSLKIAGIICASTLQVVFAGLFLWLFLKLNSKDPAENSEDVTSSWFGYKTLAPIFIAFAMGMFDTISGVLVMAAAGFVLFLIYNRGFKLDKYKWISYGASVGVGLILGIITIVLNSY